MIPIRLPRPARRTMNAPMLPRHILHAERRQGVSVRAPGRLHLGFPDPAGTLGRR
jgi:hypothetical protein